MITQICLNGSPLDLSTIEYEVQIQHGRSDVTAAPQPSNAQIIIRGSVGVAAEISDELCIRAYGARRFTGEISDVTVTHLSSQPPVAISTITAIGNLARVGYSVVGADGWDEQTVSQRVDDVLTATGLTYLNGADTEVTLHSVSSGNAEATDALSYLSSVAEWTGATFYDDPEGRIVFESYGNRGITSFDGVWSNIVGSWAANTTAWSAFPVDRTTTQLPPDTVIFTPTWSRTRQTVINSVTVLGYNDSHEITQTDSASISTYGLREYRLNTDIKDSGDVTDRAGKIITAQANPLWSLGQISILVHNLEEAPQEAILNLVSGMAVSISSLPQPAPLGQFLGIVEGWGEVYTPGEHILTLSLSDPRYSFETITWAEIPTVLDTRKNLAYNPSIETNTTGWTNRGTTTSTRINTDSKFGSACLEVTKAAIANSGVNFAVGTGVRMPVDPSTTYTISVWVKVPTGNADSGLRIRRLPYTAVTGGSAVTATLSATTIITEAMGWTRLTTTITTTSTTNALGVSIEQATAGTAGQKFLVDGLLVEKTAQTLDYFDGSITPTGDVVSNEWDGTPNASTSTQTYSRSIYWSEIDSGLAWFQVITGSDLAA